MSAPCCSARSCWVFYRQTRRRMRFVLTAPDDDWIRRRHRGDARVFHQVDSSTTEPLAQVPAFRCSLAPVCMPDETKFLQMAVPDEELPAPESQLALPGLAGEADRAVTETLADAFGTERS